MDGRNRTELRNKVNALDGKTPARVRMYFPPQQAMTCTDPADRALWLRLAKHWDEIDNDNDVPGSRGRRG